MNYNQQIKNLLAEARAGIRYANMERWEKILTIIAMIPIYAVTCVLIATYYISLFFYNALICPTEYLEGWLGENNAKVRHATEAVLYLICIPFIFANRVLMSVMSFSFYFQWFLLQTALYLSTLGGTKWQPSINLATFKKRCYKLRPGEAGTMVYTILTFGLFAFYLLLFLAYTIDGSTSWELYRFLVAIGWMYTAMAVIINPILFSKREIILEKDTEEKEQNQSNT